MPPLNESVAAAAVVAADAVDASQVPSIEAALSTRNVWTTQSAMPRIISSPYEGTGKATTSAEVGERIFDKIKSLIDPTGGLATRQMEASAEAKKVFGVDIARILVETNHHVAFSGMLYGCGWDEGIIREKFCGRLPKNLLLLCLQDQRIARSDNGNLSLVIKNLDLCTELRVAILAWKLSKGYPLVAKCKGHSMFRTKKVQCLKCIIFIARAWNCYITLKESALDESLLEKVHSCLQILEYNAGGSPTRGSKSNILLPLGMNNKKASELQRASASRVLPHEGGTLDDSILLDECDYSQEASSPSSSSRCHSRGLSHRLILPNLPDIVTTTNSTDLPGTMSHASTTSQEQQIIPANIRRVSHEPVDQSMGISIVGNVDSNKNSTISDIECESNDESNQKTQAGKLLPSSTLPRSSSAFSLLNNSRRDGAMVDDRINPDSLSDYWYPTDPPELVLIPAEIELAWLVEESFFCTRCREIDWNFIWKYSSPLLKVELRKHSSICDSAYEDQKFSDETMLGKLLRLDKPLVERRFDVLRREIRRKLLRNEHRQAMMSIAPMLRRATHPLRLQRKQGRAKPQK